MSAIVTEFLKRAPILLDLKAADFSGAVGELVHALAQDSSVIDANEFLKAVLAREAECSTAVDSGISFPHARTPFVTDIIVAAGRSQSGITHPSGVPLHLIFVIGTPKTKIGRYLMVLGFLARVTKQPQLFDQLMKVETVDEFLQPFGVQRG